MNNNINTKIENLAYPILTVLSLLIPSGLGAAKILPDYAAAFLGAVCFVIFSYLSLREILKYRQDNASNVLIMGWSFIYFMFIVYCIATTFLGDSGIVILLLFLSVISLPVFGILFLSMIALLFVYSYNMAPLKSAKMQVESGVSRYLPKILLVLAVIAVMMPPVVAAGTNWQTNSNESLARSHAQLLSDTFGKQQLSNVDEVVKNGEFGGKIIYASATVLAQGTLGQVNQYISGTMAQKGYTSLSNSKGIYFQYNDYATQTEKLGVVRTEYRKGDTLLVFKIYVDRTVQCSNKHESCRNGVVLHSSYYGSDANVPITLFDTARVRSVNVTAIKTDPKTYADEWGNAYSAQ